MAKNISLSVVTRLQDNGDGGYTLYCYNTHEELIADHPKASDGELTQKEIDEILNEDDPYENGYIGEDRIDITIDDNGVPRLSSVLSFHAGQ